MNQKPVENQPFSSSKPPVYIPPAGRPGQLPPLYQPPAGPAYPFTPNHDPAGPSTPQQKPVSPPPEEKTAVPPSGESGPQPAFASGAVNAAGQNPAAASASPSSASPSSGPASTPKYYLPLPRKMRADYQHLAQKSLTGKGSMAVLFSILFCMLFTEMILWGNLGVSALILTGIYYAFCFWYFHEKGKHFTPAALLSTLPVMAIVIGLCLSVNQSTYFITVPALLFLLAAQTALLSGLSCQPLFSWESFCALWGRLVDGPLSFLDFPFLVMSGRRKEGKQSKNFWTIFLGVLCALPVVILLLYLFASADAVFRIGLRNFFQWLRLDWGHLFTDLLLGFLGGIFLAAMLLYCRGALPKATNPVRCKRFLDPLFAIPFLGLIDLSVLAFTLVQFAYLFGGEKGSLPGGYTYAEYARQGFFELAFSLFLIFAIALFAMAFCKTDRSGLYRTIRLELLLLSLGGGVILASAVKRMLLYVGVYGLSVKRALTLWFMVTAGICFLFLAARCLFHRFPLAKCTGVAVICMICFLSLFPLNGFVARYNVNAYLGGQVEAKVDCRYLEDLSVSALPAMVDLYRYQPSENLARAINRQISANDRRHPIWGWTMDQIAIQNSIGQFREIEKNSQ